MTEKNRNIIKSAQNHGVYSADISEDDLENVIPHLIKAAESIRLDEDLQNNPFGSEIQTSNIKINE